MKKDVTKTNKNKQKTIIIIITSIVAVLIAIAIIIIAAASPFSKKGTTENSSSEESSVSENLQTESSPSNQPVRPEKVTEVYSYENNFIMPDVKQDVFYDPENGNKLPYCLFVPENYSPANKYPVILFLHGAGEIGDDNTLQLNNLNNIFKYNGDLTANAFILCPQSPEWWNLDRQYQGDQKGTLGSALHLLEKIQQTYSCDSNRIYVMGLSMGGFATWDLLEEYGDIFAAGVPICGGGNYNNGAAFKDIPIRIYHGTADNTVSFSSSQNMYNAIIRAGGQKVKFVELEGVAHNAWDYAFSDRDMFSWLFAQNKATNPTCKYEYIPYFKVTDSSGKTIISDKDILSSSYHREPDNKDMITIDLNLSTSGRNKLNKAYTSGDGSPFTVYCSTQKIYSFTATESPTDDIFSITDVFNIDNYYYFYSVVEKINS